MNLTAIGQSASNVDAETGAAFERAFGQARAAAGPVRSTFMLAGLPLNVEIVGARLAERLLRPFGHLMCDHLDEPLFRIQAWSEDETGIPIPDFSFDPKPYSADGSTGYRNQANGRALVDRAGKRILAGFDGAANLGYSDLAKPFRSLLIPLLHDAGRQLIHGGVVAAGPDAPGLLLAGRSGSGKSTVAVAALAAGFTFLGDDHVAVALEDGRYIAHSLYATCGLAQSHLAAFARLPGETVAAPDRDKRVVLLAPMEMGRLARSVAIGAIVIPSIVSGGSTRAVPASRGEALRSLIPGSISPRLPLGEPGRGWQFEGVGDLAQQLPAFRLELGPDLSDIPSALSELSAHLPPQARP